MKVAPIKKIYIHIEPVPYAFVDGAVLATDIQKGVYDIVVNSNAPREAQRITLAHELNHIFNNDFLNDLSIIEIEERANEIDLQPGKVS